MNLWLRNGEHDGVLGVSKLAWAFAAERQQRCKGGSKLPHSKSLRNEVRKMSAGLSFKPRILGFVCNW